MLIKVTEQPLRRTSVTAKDAVVDAKDAAASAISDTTDGMTDLAAAANDKIAPPRKTSRKNSVTEALAKLGGKKF